MACPIYNDEVYPDLANFIINKVRDYILSNQVDFSPLLNLP